MSTLSTLTGPLDRLDEVLPAHILEVVNRDTPIPAIAARAARLKKDFPHLVRADIGQISQVDPAVEILYGPAVGLDELRAAIAEHWTLTYGLKGTEGLPNGLTIKNVCITTGAAECLTVAFKAFAHGKVVGIPRGYWENYVNAVILGGGSAAVVDYFDAEGNLNLEGLGRQVEQENIAILLANFPNNPTGSVLTEDEALAFAAFCRERDLLVIGDEVYNRLRYDGQRPMTLLKFMPERVICLSSASKEFLMPGARVGYTVCAREAYPDKVMRKLVRANTASPNVPGQKLLLKLVETDLVDLRAGREPAMIVKVRDEMGRRKRALVKVLTAHGFAMLGRAGHDPQGTIFLMSSLPAWWNGSADTLAEKALEGGYFSAVPGDSFGLPDSLRWSYGGLDEANIAQLDRNLTALREVVA